MPRSDRDHPGEDERDSPAMAPWTRRSVATPSQRTKNCPCDCNAPLCRPRDHPADPPLRGCKRKRTLDEPNKLTENELLSRKSSGLQRYLPPLSAILRGLKSGRYSERLSSFQESVAMDRIQRIMGVLQNPRPGGRLLKTLLKIEEMLQTWFPHVRDTSLRKRQKLCPAAPGRLYSSAHCAPLTLRLHPLAVLCPAPSETQDTVVSSSSDVPPAPPGGALLPQTPPFVIRSPCLEKLLQATESLIQTRTEPRPDSDPDQNLQQAVTPAAL